MLVLAKAKDTFFNERIFLFISDGRTFMSRKETYAIARTKHVRVNKTPISQKLAELQYMERPEVTIKLVAGLQGRASDLQKRIQEVIQEIRFLPSDGKTLRIIVPSPAEYDACFTAIRRVIVDLARS
jgi:hypothetical protein